MILEREWASERGNISGRARRIRQRRRGGATKHGERGKRKRERERERGMVKRGGIGGEEGIEQLNRKRHNGPGWLWRRVIKWVPHSHTAAWATCVCLYRCLSVILIHTAHCVLHCWVEFSSVENAMERATMHEYGLRRTSSSCTRSFCTLPRVPRTSFSLSLSLFAICHPRSNPRARARAGFAGADWKENCVGKLYPRENPTDNAEFLKRTRREISPPRRRQRRSSNLAADCLVRRAREFPRGTIDGPRGSHPEFRDALDIRRQWGGITATRYSSETIKTG